MEVREGYKKTEVGVIPEDWECAELGELIQYVKGFAFKSKDYTESGIRIIRVSDTTYNSIKDECAVYMDISRAREFDEWKLYKNDIILSTVGSKPPMFDSLVGKAILVSKKYEGALLNQNAVILRSKKVNQKLIYNNLKRQNYIKYIETIFRGNANQASITLNDLFKFQFALPIDPIEQQAIAEALSDVDAVVSSLTKLINKKKNIKQGAMKELLTGKKRLEGFTGEWGKVRLGDVGKFISGSGFPLKYQSSKIDKYPFYKVSDFNNVGNGIYMKNANNYINEDVRITLSAKVIPKNAIIFAKIGAAIFLERKRIALYECCIDNNMMCFVSDSSILNEKFAYYIFQNNNLSDFNNATALPSLNAKAIGELAILVPPTVIEQTAIANILSDMDAEIEALEQKLSKYKAIKQGMMHELLNGRIRLI